MNDPMFKGMRQFGFVALIVAVASGIAYHCIGDGTPYSATAFYATLVSAATSIYLAVGMIAHHLRLAFERRGK